MVWLLFPIPCCITPVKFLEIGCPTDLGVLVILIDFELLEREVDVAGKFFRGRPTGLP